MGVIYLHIRNTLIVLFSISLFQGCSKNKPDYLTAAEKFVGCITCGDPSDVRLYATETTTRLVYRLMENTLCFDGSGALIDCPGFRKVVHSVVHHPKTVDGIYKWPLIVKDSLSENELRAWVWLQYPIDEEQMGEYVLALVYVDKAWLVDLPILE